mgnify:CR=1 FL=1
MTETLNNRPDDNVSPSIFSEDNQFMLEPVSAKRLAMLVGPYDENLKLIELRMNCLLYTSDAADE